MNRHRGMSILLGFSCQILAACELPQFGGGHAPSGTKAAVRAPISSAAASKPRQADARIAANQSASSDTPIDARSEPAPAPAPVNMVGFGEQELRNLLGAPAIQEERPPGKIWRYRKGGCALDVTLYPDVQTRKYGTLSYEVKSNDGTDQGKRACLADIQSGGRAR
ncbi:MAG TPA: hypothetical protein VJ890_19555 [Vineibacter sp.]|nr:hypothetical protein [Vineibacter sp.]